MNSQSASKIASGYKLIIHLEDLLYYSNNESIESFWQDIWPMHIAHEIEAFEYITHVLYIQL